MEAMDARDRRDVDADGEPTVLAQVGRLLEAQAQAGQAATLQVLAILKGVFAGG
jgi:hypothetical protein